MPAEQYKNLILLVVALTFIGLSLVVRLWPYGKHRTFSQHVARHRAGILYYILLMATILPLLLLFMFKWFIPTYHPPSLFGVLIVLSAISQFACTFVPETRGRRIIVHQYLAYFSADCLAPAVFLLALTSSIDIVGRIVSGISSVIMVGLIAMFVVAYSKNRGEHKYLLLVQASYFVLFFAVLLTATYL